MSTTSFADMSPTEQAAFVAGMRAMARIVSAGWKHHREIKSAIAIDAEFQKQIDEKNRIKNLEKDQLEREKAREHREFMNQIKGKVPSHDNSPRGGNRNDRNDRNLLNIYRN